MDAQSEIDRRLAELDRKHDLSVADMEIQTAINHIRRAIQCAKPHTDVSRLEEMAFDLGRLHLIK